MHLLLILTIPPSNEIKAINIIQPRSPASSQLRKEHIRLATLCAIYEKSLRRQLIPIIKQVLDSHHQRYIQSITKLKGRYRRKDHTAMIDACCGVLEILCMLSHSFIH